MQKIAVTGAGGYIGTQLVRDLVNSNYQVLAIDRYFFGMEPMKEFIGNKNVSILKKDIRDLAKEDFIGVYAVCDLACLSNDPSGEIDPALTYQINRDGRVHVAEIAKQSGVSKYIISSSCSVYGKSNEKLLTEESKTNPVSVYAKSTLQAENTNLEIANENFCVTSLRNSTVFGLSSRMRFDLVVNLMTLSAYQKNRIIIMGGGLQWRPLVHVSDVAKAFLRILESSANSVNQQIFNVGYDNFQINQIAFLVREQLPFSIEIEVAPDDADKRDYNVSFEKIKKLLNFSASKDIKYGVSEIYSALKSGLVDTGIKTNTVKWYQNIIDSNNLINAIKNNGRII